MRRWIRLCAVVGIAALVATACPPTDPTDPTDPTTGLASWKELRPAALGLSDGRLAVFKVNASGRLEYRVQEQPMVGALGYWSTAWLDKQVVESGPVLASSPSVALNADNTVEVTANGSDGVMYHLRQSLVDNALPVSSFGSWQPMPVLGAGVTIAGAPTLTEFNADALRDVVVLGSDGNFWTTSQLSSPVGSYASWTVRYGAGLGLAGSAGTATRADNGRTELWFITSSGSLRTTDSAFGGTFVDYGGAWAGSPTSYITSSNRLTVGAATPTKELAVQQFVPTGGVNNVTSAMNGSPASAKAGGVTYLFMIMDDGRVQFAPVDANGFPQNWYVIDQPGVPALQSPPDGAIVYAPGPITLTAAAVVGADEYRFELWELTAGGRTQVGGTTSAAPTWTLPAGTLTAGKNYQWTTRAYSATTKLLGYYQTFGMVASNTPGAPIRLSPTEGSRVDPFGPIVLKAAAVQGATRYRFSVANAASPTIERWATFVDSTAAPQTPVSAVVPAGTVGVGSNYRWSVVAYTGAVQGTLTAACCSTFFAFSGGGAGSSQMARTAEGTGYWLLSYAGGVQAFGDATWAGEPASYLPEEWSTIGIVARPRSAGAYWVLADSGAIYTYGGAEYYGGANGAMLPGVTAAGMAPTPSGNGYWIVGTDGSVFSFGDAQYFGNNLGGFPSGWYAVGIAPTPTGNGYWIVANSGAVYTHGDAQYMGGANGAISAGDIAIELQPRPTGDGYWIATRSGAIFAFPGAGVGAPYYGGANGPNGLAGRPAIGFTPKAGGDGYWFMGESDGAVFSYGPIPGSPYYGGGDIALTPGQPAAPADGYRYFPRVPGDVPTLTAAAGSSSNGATLKYRFRLSTDPTATTEVVDESGFQTGLSWTPKAVNLKDGRTYFWRVDTYNGNSYVSGSVRTFRVDRRFGTSGPSPYEEVGPVATNLASGNLTSGWSSPTVNGAGLSLTYNSLGPIETAEPGLPVGWSTSWAGDTSAQSLISANGTVTILMSDGSKETFTWANGGVGGNSWRPEDGSDATLIDIGGTKWVYTTADGTTHEFDGAGTLTSTTLPTDQRKSSSLVYSWSNTPVGRRMVDAKDPISQRSMTLYFQGDGQNGCPTAAPPGTVLASTGVLCSIKLMDDRTYGFFYTGASGTLQQLARIVGSDGLVTSFGWEVANVAALGGQYARLLSVTDSLANDAIAAGLRADDTSTRTTVTYKADGRVASVTRPAPTAGAARQTVAITYTSNGASVSRDGDAKPNGYSRQVEADNWGRQTLARDQGGRTTTTGWREEAPGDVQAWTQNPSGLRTGTVYDDQWKPTDTWGPAPSAWFDASTLANQYGAIPSAANQAATPRNQTAYDTGLNGMALTFFASPDLSGGVKRRTFQAGNGNFDIGAAGFDGLAADGWSMRAEGLLSPTATGNYTFTTDSDGGIRVFINDVKVVDSWYLADGALRPSTGQTFTVPLTVGKRAKVRVEYKDLGGNAYWALWWQPPGQARGWVPSANLQPNYGLVTKTIDPDGRETQTAFADPSTGLATATTQVVGGGQANLVSTSVYEPEGTGWRRQTSRRLPAGASSEVTYAYYGDTAPPVANSCGLTTANQAGRPKSTTAADPDGAGAQQAIKRWFVYDLAGRTAGLLTTTADVAESSLGTQPWVCTSFDSRGRPTSTSYPAFGGAAARTVTSDYSNPLEVKVTDPVGAITTTVDLLGRTTKYRDALGNETTSSYDVADRPVSSTLLGQTTTNSYLPDGLLDTVSVNGKVLSDNSYAADGRLTGVAYPSGASGLGNGTTGEFGYDSLLRPSSVTWKDPAGSLIASENVTRLNSGSLRERWTDGNNLNGSNADFSYDGAGRLTGAVVGATTHSYAFADTAACGSAAAAGKNSNRTSKTVAGVTRTYCYDAADRLISTSEPSVGTVGYDSRGNTTTIFGETHTYDIADRHLSTTKGTTTVAYTRDATDRIVERKVNGVTVARYVSSGGGDAPDATIDVATGAAEFVWALPGGALFTYRPASVATSVWTLPNLQGSALAVVNQNGVKQGATMIWDPDGNNISGGVPNNMVGSFDYGWLAQHQRPLEQQSGLSPMIEMGARQYSPILGRFLEIDPIEGGTANDYSYVNDPVNMADLDGNGWGFCKTFWNCKKKKDRYDKLSKAQLMVIYSQLWGKTISSMTNSQANDFRKSLRSSKLVEVVWASNPTSPPSGFGAAKMVAKGLWAYYKPGASHNASLTKVQEHLNGNARQIYTCDQWGDTGREVLGDSWCK